MLFAPDCPGRKRKRMGTDIHMWVETQDYDGQWRLTMGRAACYGVRNYDVFAVLADVRNGRGFAGCATGDGFNVIAQPRGLPVDMDPATKAQIDEHGMEHTPTWLLLPEILEFNWQQTVIQSGWVDAASFAEWLRYDGMKAPANYCGSIAGGGIRHVTPEFMLAALAETAVPEDVKDAIRATGYPPNGWKMPEALGGLFALVEWRISYEEACATFLEWARGLRAGPTRLRHTEPDRIRLVFYFDS